MKNKITLLFAFCSLIGFSQEKDSTDVAYKKRVLESIEVDFLMSYYKQDGIHSAVSGGNGMMQEFQLILRLPQEILIRLIVIRQVRGKRVLELRHKMC